MDVCTELRDTCLLYHPEEKCRSIHWLCLNSEITFTRAYLCTKKQGDGRRLCMEHLAEELATYQPSGGAGSG